MSLGETVDPRDSDFIIDLATCCVVVNADNVVGSDDESPHRPLTVNRRMALGSLRDAAGERTPTGR